MILCNFKLITKQTFIQFYITTQLITCKLKCFM